MTLREVQRLHACRCTLKQCSNSEAVEEPPLHGAVAAEDIPISNSLPKIRTIKLVFLLLRHSFSQYVSDCFLALTFMLFLLLLLIIAELFFPTTICFILKNFG